MPREELYQVEFVQNNGIILKGEFTATEINARLVRWTKDYKSFTISKGE